MTTNPKLIRLVAGRYRQMQGLRTMTDAAFPLWFAVGGFMTEERSLGFVLAIVALALYMWGRFTWMRRAVDAYYTSRYGRVGEQVVLPQNIGFLLSMAISYNQIFRDLFHMPMGARSVVMMMLLCIYPTCVAIRDFPYRSYWFLLTWVGADAALQIPAFASRDFLPIWSRNTNLAVGGALLVIGALDHLLLALALGGGARPDVVTGESPEEPCPPPTVP